MIHLVKAKRAKRYISHFDIKLTLIMQYRNKSAVEQLQEIESIKIGLTVASHLFGTSILIPVD